MQIVHKSGTEHLQKPDTGGGDGGAAAAGGGGGGGGGARIDNMKLRDRSCWISRDT